jgi:hypothetical protein
LGVGEVVCRTLEVIAHFSLVVVPVWGVLDQWRRCISIGAYCA